MVPNFYDFHAGPVGDKFLNHARWISERYERMNEQLLTLSSTFIGFLAVELALIAQVSEEQIKNLGALKYFGILGIGFLGLALVFFFKALTSNNFEIPDLERLQAALELDEVELELEPLKLMLKSDASDLNIQQSLENENAFINKHYKRAIKSAGAAQAVIVFVLIWAWISTG